MQGTPKDPKSFPFIVVGNKLDLAAGGGAGGGMSGKGGRKVDEIKGKQWAKKECGELKYFETSAAKNLNVEESFPALAKAAASHDSNEM